MSKWLMEQSWENVHQAESAHDKAEIFQKALFEQFEKTFPEKKQKDQF